ncbi:hypothetical protein JW960_02870 [candidate division KSB1 bacterium]|nr:hypothetical protein [candidate division KSB1 bacterium]
MHKTSSLNFWTQSVRSAFRRRAAERVLNLFLASFIILISSCQSPQNKAPNLQDALKVDFTGEHAQIEVGGPYVGIEMHNSSPLLNRISFYYPRANSIDLNEDYWTRENYRVFFLGLKIGDGPKQWIGLESFKFELTPYTVHFTKTDSQKTIEVQYHFCNDKPAMVARINITNNTGTSIPFELYTHLEATLKTSHSYVHKTVAWTAYNDSGAAIYVNFDDDETGNAQLFVANAGEMPQSYTTRNSNGSVPLKDKNWWMDSSSDLPREVIPKEYPDRPVVAYVYQKQLAPGKKLHVEQIIGMREVGEISNVVSYLLKNYQQDSDKYEQNVLNKVFTQSVLKTGDPALDHSVGWAKAILATNAHYLDGHIVPMPCPAEYNFYFTHDVQLTDLAAVQFDLDRVRNDLLYIIGHANEDKIIPHAYYWKDHRYVTEYAESDNWNHFWFVLLSASYLRHSGDTAMLTTLYPYLSTSIHETLKNKRDDDLFYAYRPDWWDIGRSTGPRSYMTIMAIRAIRDFVYISTTLNQIPDDLKGLETLAANMQVQLSKRLWDDDLNYLINYFEDGSMDRHHYIGSLLGPYFNVIDKEKKVKLVETATAKLLDEKIGIYNVFPMDFHLLIDFLKFNGNEAGQPGYYANGGVWPHGNAMYALALMSIGEKEKACEFIKKIMTVDGVIHSPNGQPAMYEYRVSDKSNSAMYGRVDKPQFLWAGGWYLYCLYHLLGVNENVWNISLSPYILQDQQDAQFSLNINGRLITVIVTGKGTHIRDMSVDGKPYLSAVIPQTLSVNKSIEIVLGTPHQPYLTATESILLKHTYNEPVRQLDVELKAFPGHKNAIQLISPWKPQVVLQNGEALESGFIVSSNNGIYDIKFSVTHQQSVESIAIQF